MNPGDHPCAAVSSDSAQSQSLHTCLRFSCSSSDSMLLMSLLRQRKKASDVSDFIIRVVQSKIRKPEKDASPNVKMQIAKVKLGVEFFLQVMKKGQGFIKQGM